MKKIIWKNKEELQKYLDNYATIIGIKTFKKYKEKYGTMKMNKWTSLVKYYNSIFNNNFLSIEEYIRKESNNIKRKKRHLKKQASIKKYSQYINSKKWKNKRVKFFIKYKFTCQLCKGEFTSEQLNLHHHSYERIGEEKNTDLVVVCQECHKNIHYKNGIKIKLNEKYLRKRYNELSINIF